MSFIKIKFKRKKSTNNASLSSAISNGGNLYNLNINQGEPIVFEDSNGNLYLSIGNPKIPETGEATTLAQNAKYVKLLSPETAEKGDRALYYKNTNEIIKGNNNVFVTPVASGGTGNNTLTGIVRGNGQSAMDAISIGDGAFCKKSSDTNPSFQTLPIELGGTGATTQQDALSAILGGSVLSVVNGGTGKNSLTSKGVLVGNGTDAVSAVTGTNKALYFNNSSNPTAGILPGSCGGTGLNSGSFDSTFLNALKNLLGFSKVEFGNYTASNSDKTLIFSKRPKLIIITANKDVSSTRSELSPLIILDAGTYIACQVFSGYDNGSQSTSNVSIRSSSLNIRFNGVSGGGTEIIIPKTQPFGSIPFYPFVNAETDYRYVAII